jgi:hypothetical protein
LQVNAHTLKLFWKKAATKNAEIFFTGIILILFDENEESNEDVVFSEISEENQPQRLAMYRKNAVEDIFTFQVKILFLFQRFCF